MKSKYIILFVLFVFITIPNFAQPTHRPTSVMPSYVKKFTDIGNVSYIITYDFSAWPFPDGYVFRSGFSAEDVKNETKYYSKDIQVLEIGNGISKIYSKLIYEADSAVASILAQGAGGYPSKLQKGIMNIIPMEVYKNYPQGKYTTTYRYMRNEVLACEEPYPIDFKWQLTDEKKTIHSYECQKATTTFRGRTYEAWFAMGIPISEGPHKFGGLPGLILELKDSENHYIYNCIGIEECKTKKPIKFWDWNYKKMKMEKYKKTLNSMHANYGMHMASTSSSRASTVIMKYPDGTTKSMSASDFGKGHRYPYNPIELE